MVRKWLLVGVAGFVVGVLFHSFWDFGWAFVLLLFFLSGIFLLIRSIVVVEPRQYSLYLMIVLFFGAAALGIVRYDLADRRPDQSFLDSIVGEKVMMEGLVVDEPDERETHTRVVVKLENVGGQENLPAGRQVSSKILIFAQHFPKFSYGDLVKIEGELEKPKNFQGSADPRDFDWVAYLAKDNIYYTSYYPRIELISSGQGFFLKRWLFRLKNNFLEAISAIIPEPEVSLAGGLIVGAKQSMGEELLEDFRKTGVIHIVVLSGYNVTIIARSIEKLFGSILPQTTGFALGVISIIFFALMTGAAPATVRASIMAILVLISRRGGRTYAVTAALIAAGFLMVMVNPKIAAFDTGFQLSFIATLGLIYFPPLIENYFKFTPTPFIKKVWGFIPFKDGLRELAMLTVSAQLAVLPWILYKMGTLSLVALPVNLLILAFVPATMLFGFLTGLAGFIFYWPSVPFGWITYAFLWYELKVVEIFASLPFASLELKYFPLSFTLLIYVGMVWWVVKKNQERAQKEPPSFAEAKVGAGN